MGALGISCPENSLLCYARSNAEFEGHMTKIEMHENVLGLVVIVVVLVYQNQIPENVEK